MGINNNEPMSAIERLIWKAQGFAWLSEKKCFNYHNLDNCINKLEENPTCCEAAFAAFWGIYLSDELPPIIDDLQIEKIKTLLDQGIKSRLQPEDINSLAFVKLHLAGLLTVCLIRPDWPITENPSAIDMLEKAKEACALTDVPAFDVEDPPSSGKELVNTDLLGFSTRLIAGIIWFELALRRAAEGKYEEAFDFINGAVWHLAIVTFEDESGQMAAFKPYMPHSGLGFNIQEVIKLFEELKAHAHNIENWQTISEYCDIIRYLGWFYLYNPNEQVRKPFIAEGLTVFEYWGRATTYAEERHSITGSPIPILTRDAIERTETKERIKRDFIGNLWELIDKPTQDNLVDVEIQWMHSRLDNMVKEIRQVLEMILINIFPFLEYTIKQNDGHLIIWRIREAIEKDPNIRKSIERLSIGNHDKIWIKEELTKFLREINHVRNYFEKDQYLPGKNSDEKQKMTENAIAIHHKLLGIGCEGTLPRLLRIKKGQVNE